MKIISLKSDYVFKLIFAKEDNKELLKELLEEILNIHIDSIDDIEVLKDAALDKQLRTEKFGVLDLRVKLQR